MVTYKNKMVTYNNLPIYKSALDLAIYFEKIVENFSRYHKYTLGTSLRNQSRKIATQVMRANANKKIEDKEELISQIEELKLLIRLTKEVKAFNNFNSYSYSSKLIANLSKQAEGWHSHSLKKILI